MSESQLPAGDEVPPAGASTVPNLPAEIDRIGESWAPSGIALPLE